MNDTAVDVTQKGTYDVFFTTKDSAGNRANTKASLMVAKDGDLPPIITPKDVTISQNDAMPKTSEFVDTVVDDKDVNLSADDVKITSAAVDTSKAGSYVIDLAVTDSAENVGTATANLIIEDTEAPVITANNINMTINTRKPFKKRYIESVIDNLDGNINIHKVSMDDSAIDITQLGDYTVNFSVVDKAGNEGKTSAVLSVKPETDNPPEIISKNLEINQFDTMPKASEFVVRVKDDIDNLTPDDVTITSGKIDTSKPGTYEIKLSVTDSGDNTVTTTTQLKIKVVEPLIKTCGEFSSLSTDKDNNTIINYKKKSDGTKCKVTYYGKSTKIKLKEINHYKSNNKRDTRKRYYYKNDSKNTLERGEGTNYQSDGKKIKDYAQYLYKPGYKSYYQRNNKIYDHNMKKTQFKQYVYDKNHHLKLRNMYYFNTKGKRTYSARTNYSSKGKITDYAEYKYNSAGVQYLRNIKTYYTNGNKKTYTQTHYSTKTHKATSMTKYYYDTHGHFTHKHVTKY